MNDRDREQDENKEFNDNYVYTDGEFWDEPNKPLSQEEEERSMIETYIFGEEQRKKEMENPHRTN